MNTTPIDVSPAGNDAWSGQLSAFAMGFMPWAFEQAGPRGDLSPTQGNRT